ncbi:MAG TPA: SurA N-terminal domain-containing protein [Candidatus Nanoarchaeia archaeon]|nr:SurA N-terminal domain-containing protein [Candidatus Nanoarchaeia archaeon]
MKAEGNFAIIPVVLVVIVAAAVLSGCAIFRSGDSGPSREVAALVNGEKIYFDDVNEEYAFMPPEQQASIAKADALSFLIEREVLYQAALKEGLSATNAEVKQESEFYFQESNQTEAQLKVKLAAAGSSAEKFNLAMRKQVLINKLLDKKVPNQFVIKHEEVEALYNASRFPLLNISFDEAQKSLVELINTQRLVASRNVYIESLKDKADVLIVGVPS